MKKSTKALLCSALVIPGGGYFVLGAKKRGMAAIAAAVTLIGMISFDSAHKAQTIAQDIVDGKIPLDIATIGDQIATTPGLFSDSTMSVAVALLMLLWIVGMVDVYRLGRGT